MPRFRSGVLREGGSGLELANTHRAREEERERNRDGENSREKEEEMQSLSGMQLGARHRPGKDSSLSVFLLESSFSFFPPSFASFFVFLFSFRSSTRSITYTDFPLPLARFPIIHVSAYPHTNTHTRANNYDYRKYRGII